MSVIGISLSTGNTTNPSFFRARNQDFTIASIGSGLVTFNWSYLTRDSHGARFDPFGFLLNGMFHKLTNNSHNKRQHGTYSVEVHKGDIFGFRERSINSHFGSATATVTNFSAPVPIPAAIWLMVTPLIGLLGFQPRKAVA
jgi:hypothetical protein